jgi:hypothetical protein
MSIQVSSSVHAAFTLYVTQSENQLEAPSQFLQSPQGGILQRLPIDNGDPEENNVNGWMMLLDYGLDPGSCGFSLVPFGSIEPRTRGEPTPVVPVLFHIDERVKLLVTVALRNGQWEPVSESFHAFFLNFQSNQRDLYPVDIGVVPAFP